MQIYFGETEERGENEESKKIPLKLPQRVITAKLWNLPPYNILHPMEYSV